MTVRVGVIGTGNIGTAHARRLAREIAGTRVSVVHDFDAARAAEVAAELGARAVDGFEEVFAADDVDAVLVASPDAIHAGQLLAGLGHGKPILCEKPLATTSDDARQVVDAVGLSIMSGAHLTIFPAVLAALKAVGADDVAVFGGGIIPADDIAELEKLGVARIFTPGATTASIIEWVRANVSSPVA